MRHLYIAILFCAFGALAVPVTYRLEQVANTVLHAHGGGLLVVGFVIGALLAVLYATACVTFCKRTREWPLYLAYVVALVSTAYAVQSWCRMFDPVSLVLIAMFAIAGFVVAFAVSLCARGLAGQAAVRHVTPRVFTAGVAAVAVLGIVLSIGRPLERCRFGLAMTNGVCASTQYYFYNAKGDVLDSMTARGVVIDTGGEAQLCMVEYVAMESRLPVQYQVGRLEKRKVYFEHFHPVYSIVFSDLPTSFPLDLPARDAAIAESAGSYPDTWDHVNAIRVTARECPVQWPPVHPSK